MVNWFRRRPGRVVVPRLKSRGETPAGVNRVDLTELTPGLMPYLGQAAYLQLTVFEALSRAVISAPTTSAKEEISRVASLSLLRHQALVAEIERKGEKPGEVMEPYAQGIDVYRQKTVGGNWYEELLSSYVTSGILDDFFRRLATGLPGGSPERMAEIFATADGHEILLHNLQGGIDADQRLASSLAMWGRRLVGDTLLIARSALAMPQDGHPDEARLEPVFTELIAAHTRRMDGLGLTA